MKYLQKKVKISGVKRSHHVRNKKNFARPTKKKETTAKPNQKSQSTTKKVFGKTIGSGTSKKNATKAKRDATKRKVPEIQQNGNHNHKAIVNGAHKKDEDENDNEEEESHDIDDLMGMIDDDDELHANYGATAKRRKHEAEDDEGKHHEVEFTKKQDAKKASGMRTIDLLPIKTKAGEIITRSAEVEMVEEEQSDEEADAADDEDGEEEFLDSDDDIVNDKRSALESESKNAISTADLLIYREQEINRQKFRIANICSGILENPENKMKNFKALLELMDERLNNTVNLFTVRKLAMTSLLEVFKDILPEYRIGQIDLKKQTGRVLV